MSQAGEEGLRHVTEGPGQTLFEFVRHWSRRSNAPTDGAAAQNGRYVLVAEAVQSVAKRENPTINVVAREIGIDQSGASRLVKQAVDAGYLEMEPSQFDARQRVVVLTTAGRALIEDAHRWQETVFQQLTRTWSDNERVGFHRAMLRLLERSYTMSP